MIRTLDDLALLKEIDTLNLSYTSSQLRREHKNKIVIIKHTAFIKKEVLCEIAKEKTTDLSDYLHIGELADQLSITKPAILRRIFFMRATGLEMFSYKKINKMYFIKVDKDLKYLFQNYQPFIVAYHDLNNI